MENRFSEIDYNQFKEQGISGRYIVLENIEPIIKKLGSKFKIGVEGFSEENRPLYSITYGKGNFKILMWSQMHGNESTTSKAIFDLINFLSTDDSLGSKITLKILPMLNPDGALRYTRENANGVDLNRDAFNKSQSEIKSLFSVFENFKPDLCLNMHDQRSIFSAGRTPNPAVVSFLAPAADEARSIPANRSYAMQLIAVMNSYLQNYIPQKVGRYNDDFNANCLGDTFQSLGVPAILFEAGHFNGDYQREQVRMYIFLALISLLHTIVENADKLPNVDAYFNIPENEKLFFDIIIRNVTLNEKVVDVAIQFEERKNEKKIDFIPKISKIGGVDTFFGHKTIDAKNSEIIVNNSKTLSEDSEIYSISINGKEILMN